MRERETGQTVELQTVSGVHIQLAKALYQIHIFITGNVRTTTAHQEPLQLHLKRCRSKPAIKRSSESRFFFPLAPHPPDPALQPAAEVPPRPLTQYLRQFGVVDVPGELHAGGRRRAATPAFLCSQGGPRERVPSRPRRRGSRRTPSPGAGRVCSPFCPPKRAPLTLPGGGRQPRGFCSYLSPRTKGPWPLQVGARSGRLMRHYPGYTARSCGWRTGGEPVPMPLMCGAERGSELPSDWEPLDGVEGTVQINRTLDSDVNGLSVVVRVPPVDCAKLHKVLNTKLESMWYYWSAYFNLLENYR